MALPAHEYLSSWLRLVLATMIVAGAVSVSSIASAQPWMGPEGELTLALHTDYQSSQGIFRVPYGVPGAGVVDVTGLPVDVINTSFMVEYVPIKRLAVTATLYGNDVAYEGPQSGQSGVFYAHGPNDDGNFHTNLTDLELEARYQLYDGPITITPVIGTRFPLTNYPVAGYAAAGTHLAEGTAGLNLGRYGFILDDLVLQASWTFTYVEKESGGGAATEAFRTNRTDASFAAMYSITSKLTAGIGLVYRYTFNGFNLSEYTELESVDPTNPLVNYQPQMGIYPWHDPVLRQVYVVPVALVGFQFSDNWQLLGRVAKIIWGDNVSDALSVGLTLSYSKNLKD